MGLFSKAVFFTTVNHLRDLPMHGGKEVAFVGRSNAGKSSAINTLANHTRLAFTSKTPGRTQHLNYFDLSDNRYLVDLPGYGYAKRSKSERQDLLEWTQDYFRSSQRLRLVVQLVDIRRELQPLDVSVNEWLQEIGLNVQVVATKIDKLSRGPAASALRSLKACLGMPADSAVIGYSVLTPAGRGELIERLVEAVEFDAVDTV